MTPTIAFKPSLVERESSILGDVRKGEWVIAVFLMYASSLAAVMPIDGGIRFRTISVNVAILLAYGLLVTARRSSLSGALSILRDWLPLAFALLAYQEMGWFAVPHSTHSMETQWVAWDRVVLNGGLRAAIESVGPLIPAVLEISYSLVYALAPFSLVTLHTYGRRDRVDHFTFVFLAGVLLCYAQYPFWPSDPPRTLFPNDDLPTYLTVFRRFNLWMLGKGGIHTSVFPSGHVGAAFAVAAGMVAALPEHKWVGRLLTAIAVLIAVATVYGRYHYLTDATAGLFMAGLAILASHQFKSPAMERVSLRKKSSLRWLQWTSAARLLLMLMGASACAAPPTNIDSPSTRTPQGLAYGSDSPEATLGRYLTLLPQRSVADSGNIGVEIEASLTTTDRSAHLQAIRHQGTAESIGSTYQILVLEGDSTVKQQVIARYLTAQSDAEAIPSASLAINAENYRFHFLRSFATGRGVTHVFEIVPKQKRAGLIRGELWLDAVSGLAIRQSGILVKWPSVFVRKMEIARDTELVAGRPSLRTTHISIDTRLAGRAELTVSERPLALAAGALSALSSDTGPSERSTRALSDRRSNSLTE